MEIGKSYDEGSASGSSSPWGMSDPPRIRSITGVRIHQLTIPESIPLASKLRPSPSLESSLSVPEDGYFLGESSRLSSSPSLGGPLRRSDSAISRKERRISLSSPEVVHGRARAGSGSTLGASPGVTTGHVGSGGQHGNGKERVTRPRARTLAGEALEHEKEKAEKANLTGQGGENVNGMMETSEGSEVQRRQLARCFIAFRIPPLPSHHNHNDSNGHIGTEDRVDIKGKGKAIDSEYPGPLRRSVTSVNSRPSRSTSMDHLQSPTTPNGRESPSSLNQNTPPRSRTSSVNTLTSPVNSKNPSNVDMPSPTSGSMPKLGQRPPRLVRAGSEVGRSRPPGRPVSMISRGSYRSPHLSGISDPSVPESTIPPPLKLHASNPHPSAQNSSSSSLTPFFLSPIHPPSSYPAFPSLLPESDFASWLSTSELAAQEVEVEVWYEDPSVGWRTVSDLGGRIHLRHLRRVEPGKRETENGLEFSLKGDLGGWYALPDGNVLTKDLENEAVDGKGRKRGASVKGVIERSVRETRMKKGVGVGGLHQLIHGQSVVEDTQQNIKVVQAKIDLLLQQDVDRRALRREVGQRSERVKWLQSKIDEINKLSQEVEAAITLRQKDIANRRHNLSRAEEQDRLDRSRAARLDESIETADRAALIPLIHHYRAHHIQTLDALFPILPLSPSILLYGILGVPLPIPSGKDPAPPITLPPSNLPEGVKVDEKTLAAALGYVAMVVHILGILGGTGPGAGGLVYPVTCAGSRSLVRDVVSVMQGPRSFPLYTKGVERYRFDYAVFLLNTNIELLMQEANIRLMDRRHTLPNLKSLLLTLSSPAPPPPPPTYRTGTTSAYPVSGTTTYNNSRVGSRTASYTFHPGTPAALSHIREKGAHGTPGSVSCIGERESPGSVLRGGRESRERELHIMSPIKGWGDTGVRGKRSHLSRQSWGGSEDMDGDGETAVSRSELLSDIGTEEG